MPRENAKGEDATEMQEGLITDNFKTDASFADEQQRWPITRVVRLLVLVDMLSVFLLVPLLPSYFKDLNIRYVHICHNPWSFQAKHPFSRLQCNRPPTALTSLPSYQILLSFTVVLGVSVTVGVSQDSGEKPCHFSTIYFLT